MTGRWSTSTRRRQLPPNWEALRRERRRLARGRCEAERHAPACDGIGRELDHHEHRDDHRIGSLRWLSSPCHEAKTQAEAAAARPSRRNAVEPSPFEQLAAAQAATAAAGWGEDPPRALPGTGGDSSGLRIQVPGLHPSPEPVDEDLEQPGQLDARAQGSPAARRPEVLVDVIAHLVPMPTADQVADAEALATVVCRRCLEVRGHAPWCPARGVGE